MDQIQLTQSVQNDITQNLSMIRQLSSQIKILEAQRADHVKIVNYIWRSEYRKEMLDNNVRKIIIPDLINAKTGNINVTIENGIASWQAGEE